MHESVQRVSFSSGARNAAAAHGAPRSERARRGAVSRSAPCRAWESRGPRSWANLSKKLGRRRRGPKSGFSAELRGGRVTDNGLVCALPDRSSAAEIRKYQDPLVIREVLQSARTIAIVGLSSNV